MLAEKIGPSHGERGTAVDTQNLHTVDVARPDYFILYYGFDVISALLLLAGDITLSDKIDCFLECRIGVDWQTGQGCRDHWLRIFSLDGAHGHGTHSDQGTKKNCSAQISKHRETHLTNSQRSIDPDF